MFRIETTGVKLDTIGDAVDPDASESLLVGAAG
jgi:hypothetical protein